MTRSRTISLSVIYLSIHYTWWYYKELTQRTVDDDKSPNLLSASWRPRAASTAAPVWRPACLRPRQSQCFSFRVKIGRNWCLRSRRLGRKGSLLLREVPAFVFHSGLQGIGWGLPTSGSAACFIQATDSNVNLIRKYLTNSVTWNNIWL